MRLHQGRLLDHVHIRGADIAARKGFYGAVLEEVGRGWTFEGDGYFADVELVVSADGPPTSGLHLAFQTPDRETVPRFREAGLAAGGRDNGAPGERHYHPGYYGAYVLDPDGNNIEAVNHGPAKRSADSI